MSNYLKKLVGGVAVLAALAVGGAAIAGAATPNTTTSKSSASTAAAKRVERQGFADVPGAQHPCTRKR